MSETATISIKEWGEARATDLISRQVVGLSDMATVLGETPEQIRMTLGMLMRNGVRRIPIFGFKFGENVYVAALFNPSQERAVHSELLKQSDLEIKDVIFSTALEGMATSDKPTDAYHLKLNIGDMDFYVPLKPKSDLDVPGLTANDGVGTMRKIFNLPGVSIGL